MELFDFVKALFSKNDWEKVSKIDKEKYFFIVNRFMCINFPRQASMFNIKHIPKIYVMDYWHTTLSKLYNTVPSWVYTKGQKSSKADKEKDLSISDELVDLFCSKNQCSKSDLELLSQLYPDSLQPELEELELVLKSLKSKE